MVFTVIGVLASPLGFSLVEMELDFKIVTLTAEIALIIILFSDASGLNLRRIKWGIPARLLFIGWFGPRGIASILYVLIVVSKVISIDSHETIYAVVTVTVLLSIFLHGFSTNPLITLYAKNNNADEH